MRWCHWYEPLIQNGFTASRESVDVYTVCRGGSCLFLPAALLSKWFALRLPPRKKRLITIIIITCGGDVSSNVPGMCCFVLQRTGSLGFRKKKSWMASEIRGKKIQISILWWDCPNISNLWYTQVSHLGRHWVLMNPCLLSLWATVGSTTGDERSPETELLFVTYWKMDSLVCSS